MAELRRWGGAQSISTKGKMDDEHGDCAADARPGIRCATAGRLPEGAWKQTRRVEANGQINGIDLAKLLPRIKMKWAISPNSLPAPGQLGGQRALNGSNEQCTLT